MMTANSDQRTKDEVRKYFNDASLPDFGVDARFFSTAGKKLVELAGIRAGHRVLDVAAGRGAILFPAAEQVGAAGEIIGIDLAEGMVNSTNKEIEARGLEHVSMRLMDAEQLDFESGAFDRVTCGFAMFFFPDLPRTLREFFRVLKPDGLLAATTFGPGADPMHWYEALLAKYGLGRTIPCATALDHPEALKGPYAAAGFKGIRVAEETIASDYEDEEDWWSHLWSTADRRQLEALREEELASLKREAFDGIKALKVEGAIRVPYRVLFTIGTKARE
jgi:O-methyltransferase/aklanonic acid methyltransferase